MDHALRDELRDHLAKRMAFRVNGNDVHDWVAQPDEYFEEIDQFLDDLIALGFRVERQSASED